MSQRKNAPLSHKRFLEILDEHHEEDLQEFENNVIKILGEGGSIQEVSGFFMDFFERFRGKEEQHAAIMAIFLFGTDLGKAQARSGSSKTKKKGNGQSKN